MQRHRRPRASLPNQARTGLDWAQPAVYDFESLEEDAGEGARAPQAFLIFNTRPFKAGCWRFGVATLCMTSQPKWGSNGEDLDKGLCLQQRRMGTHGEESCKSFRNG